MLEALPAAQSAGQKAQEDAQLRPGLDLRPRRAAAEASRRRRGPAPRRRSRRGVRPARAAGAGEGDARHLPLRAPARRGPRRAAGRGSTARSPSSRGKPDGAWVTVGGIVTECKKIRTKSGGHVMFATLDDVEGQVEMLVLRRPTEAESAEVIEPDAIVLVRGRSTTRTAARPSSSSRRPSLRARRGRGRGGAGEGRSAPSRAASCCGSTPPSSAPRLVEELKARLRRLPGRRRGPARDADPRGRAAAAVRRATTGSRPRRRSAPSSTSCSARRPWRPEPLGFSSR